MSRFSRDGEPNVLRKLSGALLNILTLLVLLGVVCNAVFFLAIYFDPHSALNPFPPPTPPVLISLPSATPTSINFLPPTWTPTSSPVPTITETPSPSTTPRPIATALELPTALPTATKPLSGYQFILKNEPQAVPNIAHTELGCNWMGVAGTVEDINGGPKTQLIVVLGGTLDGRQVDPSGVKYSLTGVAPQYGPAGYEFVLADYPIRSVGTLWVQLLDQAGGPLSNRAYFDTYDDCNKNLILVTFKQQR